MSKMLSKKLILDGQGPRRYRSMNPFWKILYRIYSNSRENESKKQGSGCKQQWCTKKPVKPRRSPNVWRWSLMNSWEKTPTVQFKEFSTNLGNWEERRHDKMLRSSLLNGDRQYILIAFNISGNIYTQLCWVKCKKLTLEENNEIRMYI